MQVNMYRLIIPKSLNQNTIIINLFSASFSLTEKKCVCMCVCISLPLTVFLSVGLSPKPILSLFL